jgi:hypothetical protein
MPPTLRAADVISPVEMSTSGTVSKIDATQKIVTLKFETGTETRYQFTSISRLFDPAGKPLAMENLRPGLKLTVFFERDGEDLVVSRATIGQPSSIAQNPTPAPNPTPSQPAENNGVVLRTLVMEVLPDSSTIVVKTDTGASVRYRYTKTTQMVDETGNMVTLDAIRAGTRATLQFTRIENELVLTRIIVVEPGPVISTQASIEPVLTK